MVQVIKLLLIMISIMRQQTNSNGKYSYIILESMCCTFFGSHVGGHRKLKEFKKQLRVRRMTTFIYRHRRILVIMREKAGGADLVRPTATRFATFFLRLKSLYKHKNVSKA